MLTRERGLIGVIAVSTVAALVYATYGILIHRTLHTTAFDLAFFDQILWNTARGRWFQTTYVPYNFLGQHFEQLLLLPAALYRIGAGPQTLIAIQAAVASLAAVPLYLAGRRLVGTVAAVLISLAYLLSPFLEQGLDFGFHPDLLIPLFAFSALAALLAERRGWFIAFGLALLLVKEDAFLVVAALGWICYLRCNRRFGVAVIAGSLLYGGVVIGLLMPLFRGGHSSDLVERYGYLGSTAPGIVAGVLTHPDRVLAHLASPDPVRAVLGMLAWTAFMPLLAPEVLLAAIPVALIGLLSTHERQQSLGLQYGAPVLAVVFIAALFGLVRLSRFLARPPTHFQRWPVSSARFTAAVAAVLLCASATGAALYGPFPPSGGAELHRFQDNDGSADSLARVGRLIPADASLSAQSGLASHLSQRRIQWEFPRLEGAGYAIVQDGGERSSQSNEGFEEKRARLPALGYAEIAHDGSIHLYRRLPESVAQP